MLLSSSFVAEIDELKNHYDIRQIYAREMGQALAKKVDQHLLQLTVLASAASATISGGNTGGSVIDADCISIATSMISSVFEGIQ